MREVRDPVPSHNRTRLVYSVTPKPAGETREMEVTLAQLRSGHSKLLAAYRNRIGTGDESMCPRCEEEPETLEHWLQGCPATMNIRLGCFGMVQPPLSILAESPGMVASYIRRLRPP